VRLGSSQKQMSGLCESKKVPVDGGYLFFYLSPVPDRQLQISDFGYRSMGQARQPTCPERQPLA
jgi:hypothetical protein